MPVVMPTPRRRSRSELLRPELVSKATIIMPTPAESGRFGRADESDGLIVAAEAQKPMDKPRATTHRMRGRSLYRSLYMMTSLHLEQVSVHAARVEVRRPMTSVPPGRDRLYRN